ncbi:hypothetical protein AB4Z52_26655 [Rhizobium sp. 2YAF20]|uniref:hypothetical protein n=1 Tax=Rhizobium sp. 2YAF20 TaxID=3233027 RepID=UPI003F957EA0
MSAIAAVTKQIRITTAITILCRRYPRSPLIVATGRNMRFEFDVSPDSTVSGTLTLSEHPNTRLRATIQPESRSTDLT